MQPLAAWSPGFNRSKQFGPPDGATPNQPGFIECLHDFDAVHWDHEPTPSPSKEGSRPARPVPLLGGVRGGFVAERFMESPFRFFECIGTMNRDRLVTQAFRPAGSRDIPVPCFCFWRLESRPNRQTGMSALRIQGSWKAFRVLDRFSRAHERYRSTTGSQVGTSCFRIRLHSGLLCST